MACQVYNTHYFNMQDLFEGGKVAPFCDEVSANKQLTTPGFAIIFIHAGIGTQFCMLCYATNLLLPVLVSSLDGRQVVAGCVREWEG